MRKAFGTNLQHVQLNLAKTKLRCPFLFLEDLSANVELLHSNTVLLPKHRTCKELELGGLENYTGRELEFTVFLFLWALYSIFSKFFFVNLHIIINMYVCMCMFPSLLPPSLSKFPF